MSACRRPPRTDQDSPRTFPACTCTADAAGDVLYVGKALSLRKRLANYLPALPRAPTAAGCGAKVTGDGEPRREPWSGSSPRNEVEALLLEHNLIKQHRPPFNIRLRDDKSYPYIMITMEDEFPRVMFTRQPHRRGNLYFGPFASAAKVRETLDVLGRVFPVRTCRGRRAGAARRARPACSSTSSAARLPAWADVDAGRVPGRGRPGRGLPERARDQGGGSTWSRSMQEAAEQPGFRERRGVPRPAGGAAPRAGAAADRVRAPWARPTSPAWPWTTGAPTCRSSSPGTASWPTGAASRW